MAGFLDKNERFVDMVLTSRGKLLLSQGSLSFVYWVAFDDEIDYTPVVYSTGSMSQADIADFVQRQIEETPIREATTGYRDFNRSGSDHTNVIRPLFTMPQGQQVLPRFRVIEGPSGSDGSVSVKQTKVTELHVQTDQAGNTVEALGPFDRGYAHSDPTTLSIEMGYSQDSFPPDHKYEGFLIRVYESGSEGTHEVGQRHDLQSDLCYNDDMKIFAAGVAANVG